MSGIVLGRFTRLQRALELFNDAGTQEVTLSVVEGLTPGLIALKIQGSFFPLNFIYIQGELIYDQDGNQFVKENDLPPFPNTPIVLQSLFVNGLSASGTLFTLAITQDSRVRVSPFVLVTAFTAGATTPTIDYTDQDGNAVTFGFGAFNTLGSSRYSALCFTCKAGTNLVFRYVHTGISTFDFGGCVEFLY